VEGGVGLSHVVGSREVARPTWRVLRLSARDEHGEYRQHGVGLGGQEHRRGSWDDKNAFIVVGEGDIGYLVHLLDSNITVIWELADMVVSILSLANGCKHILVVEWFGW
jgi:hypothetical protein